MKKRLLIVALVLVAILTLGACTTGGGGGGAADEPATTAPATETPAGEDTPAAGGGENPNAADYTFIEPAGTQFDLITYYNSIDPAIDASSITRSMGGTVRVPDNPTTAMPKANGDWTIGFSVYNTFDDIGAQILDAMEAAAAEAGVKLLVNDASYDQNAQNAAIEQWIVQKVDGVILAPCDFHGVKDSLDKLEEAGIPVVTINAPLAGAADAMVMGDCLEQGEKAGIILMDHFNAEGTDIQGGTIVYQTLPFVHPNAILRVKGFVDLFDGYDINFIELTGDTIESHYGVFEGAMQANPDMIGAYGVYDSVTIGMMNASRSAGKHIPLTSVDNDRIILAGIYTGDILGSACYSATAPSWWSMNTMINLLNGVEVPGVLFYQTIAVVPDNVEEMFEHYFYPETLQEYLGNQ